MHNDHGETDSHYSRLGWLTEVWKQPIVGSYFLRVAISFPLYDCSPVFKRMSECSQLARQHSGSPLRYALMEQK